MSVIGTFQQVRVGVYIHIGNKKPRWAGLRFVGMPAGTSSVPYGTWTSARLRLSFIQPTRGVPDTHAGYVR
ncbi:hypothetical protein [Pseudomonas phage PIP]|nr:hypothetical protein [Pseudomonas phage PIP]